MWYFDFKLPNKPAVVLKLVIKWRVLGRGNQTAEGLSDVPREFVNQLIMDPCEDLNEKYTALHHAPIINVQTRSAINFSSGQSFLGAGVMDRKFTDSSSFAQLVHKGVRL